MGSIIFQPYANSESIELKSTLEFVGSDILPTDSLKSAQAFNEEISTLKPKTTQTTDESQYDHKPQKKYPFGTFTMHINNEEISIAYGVDEATLKQMHGWLENSACPGKVVYDYRNRKHLRALKDVEMDKSSFCYIVESIEIMNSKDELIILALGGEIYLRFS